jgi:cytochrome P450
MSTKTPLDAVTFLDPAVQECPFPVYERLHDEAPVFFDRRAGFWVVTRYDDIREILTDPRRFSSGATIELMRDTVDPLRARAAREMYQAGGWVPAPTLSLMDDPRHKEVRAIFQNALRAGKVKGLDPLIRQTAYDLVDGFVDDGRCEIVARYCVPLPLIAICSQVGVPIDDVWMIKRWTDAWMRRFSMMQTPEEEAESIRQEIEFQHYFVDVVEDLRRQPNDSILSDLVNASFADGSTLTYAEIASHLLADIFVGGSETSTNALSEGVLLLCQYPDQYLRLMADLQTLLPAFVDEVLRLQSPVQGLYRVTTCPVVLHDQEIPAGALLNLRFAAANRDARHFSCPASMDIDRDNVGSHLAFGSGKHHCIGAPLARRELYWGFDALLRRCANICLAPGRNDLAHRPGLMLRAMKELHIEYDPVSM